MDDITTVSVIVIIANAITGTTSATLLLLIFFQNPRDRVNQLFSITMLGLTLYSLFNIMSRLSPQLELDPATITYTTASLYLVFVVGLFLASMAFADLHSNLIRGLTVAILIGFVFNMVVTWVGYADKGIEPVSGQPGSYEAELTVLGQIGSLISFSFLLVTAIILYTIRHQATRLRGLWQAPAFALVGVVWLVTAWRATNIPLNAILLALSAYYLGRAVLIENLFNPLADLSRELQEKNAQLHEADRIKNRFMAKMSHKLRTPLNSIIGYTDLVVDGLYGDLNEQQADRLEKVLRNGRNLLDLINDILDLSYIETGQVMLNPEDVSTVELLENVVATIEPIAQSKNLDVIRAFEDAPNIFIDKTRAQQIVTNILSNAVKFTDTGYIRVRAVQADNMLQLEFEDTGIGIAPEKIDLVFEEFRQIDSTPTRQFGGTGLGMSITKRLVQMSDGQIWLESEPGTGTTFYVKLPTADASHAKLVDQPPKTSQRTLSRPLKILVIDDDPEAQRYVHDALKAERPAWQVYLSSNGRDGIKQAKSLGPDVITLDIMMPNMDGWEVLKILKDSPATASIPVAVVSMVDNHALAFKLGAAAILPKPVPRQKLVETLEGLARHEEITLQNET